MSATPWGISWFPSAAATIAFAAFLGVLLVALVYRLAGTVAKPQERRPKKRRRRGGKGDAGGFLILEASWPAGTRSPVYPEMDAVYKIAHEFNRTVEDLTRYLDALNCETAEGSDSSWTSITASEFLSSSSVSPFTLKEDPHNSIMTSEANSSAVVSPSPLREDPLTSTLTGKVSASAGVSPSLLREDPLASTLTGKVSASAGVTPSLLREDPLASTLTGKVSASAEVSVAPLSDDSCNSIMASHVGCSSQASFPALMDGADTAHASSEQPGLGHPRVGPEEQPGPATHPPCEEEVASCLEAGSVQQHQQVLKTQLAAPTPPPEVPDIHSREMETPLNKGQDTLEGLIPVSKLEQELGLPAALYETPQNVAASAPATRRRREKRDELVVPMVRDLPFLDDAVKRELEQHIVKMKIQQRYGLHTRILECEQSFESMFLR